MKRRNKAGQLVSTRNIKVTVEGTEVPRTVQIFTVYFRAELYIFPVKQCTWCWKFGHTKPQCTGNPKCVNCGREHDEQEDCTEPTKCVNCHQQHESNDKECPERERRENILERMQRKRIPFAEAERAYPKHPEKQNRYAALMDESDFPELLEPGLPGSPNRGAVPRRQRSRTERQSGKEKSNGRTGTRRTSQQRAPAQRTNQTSPIASEGNPYRTTELERLIARLTADIKRFVLGFDWMAPLVQLRSKLESEVQKERTGLETDQLLIEISMELGRIIDGNIASGMDQQNNAEVTSNGL